MRILFLTDHTSHQKHDSFYNLTEAVFKQNAVPADVSVASRGYFGNVAFFNNPREQSLYGRTHCEKLSFQSKNDWFTSQESISLADYDVIVLRIDHPISKDFLLGLKDVFGRLIVNDPVGMYHTGSKEYLLNFPNLTPEIVIVRSLREVREFRDGGHIVTKPLRDYGGNGLVRLNSDSGYIGNRKVSYITACLEIERQFESEQKLLVSEFLPGVREGDKRIIVINGNVLGALLRLPATDSWLCNLNQGGSIQASEITQEEEQIVAETHQRLEAEGIVIYGIDTLIGNEGKRVLTELNTSNVGGFRQIQELTGMNTSKIAGEELVNFIQKKLPD